MGSIVFVHGTGVRLKDYTRRLETARRVATTAGITEGFIECAWGDPLGVAFDGLSLPDPPDAQKSEQLAQDQARWDALIADPLFELDQLTIRDPRSPPGVPGVKPQWLELWERIEAYVPSTELRLLLDRTGLLPFWEDAWAKIVRGSRIPKQAFEASAHELPDVSHALARAVIAQLHVCANGISVPGPARSLRNRLFEQLVSDWKQQVYGLGTFFAQRLKRRATETIRKKRELFTDAMILPLGDILLYQSRGAEIREFIREKTETAEPPVTLVAHSLGGIACVDLLALPNPPRVSHLVTVGSQASLFYELGALTSLKTGQPLPEGFPRWMNIFDRDDFLSYVTERLWTQGVTDVEFESGQPFPDSHSAYFGDEGVWKTICEFIAR